MSLWVKSALSRDSGSGSGSLSPFTLRSWSKIHFPSSTSQQSEPKHTTIEVTSGSLLQSGWSTRVKINHLFNPTSYKVICELCFYQWISLDQSRIQVFIPPEGLDLIRSDCFLCFDGDWQKLHILCLHGKINNWIATWTVPVKHDQIIECSFRIKLWVFE